MRTRTALLPLLVLCACSRCDGAGSPDDFVVGGDRPVEVRVPDAFDPRRPTPLLVLLHPFAGDPVGVGRWLGLRAAAKERGLLFAAPSGTVDRDGKRFWNATPACCDFYRAGVDDVGYLTALIDEVGRKVAVDVNRIFVVGYSNGGFMAYRLACTIPGKLAAIVSIAGAMPETCPGDARVSVVQIHGDEDRVVPFDGGQLFGTLDVREAWRGHQVPGVLASTGHFASAAHCETTPRADGTHRDLDLDVEGEETSTLRYPGCDAGVGIEVWKIAGGGHGTDRWSPALAASIVDFLLAHPRR